MKATGRTRLITIERATLAQDASGQEVETWSTLAQAYAEKTDVSDSERVAASEVSANITTRFLLLWSDAYDDVNPRDRITFEGKTYDIWGAKEIGFHEGIEITATARAD